MSEERLPEGTRELSLLGRLGHLSKVREVLFGLKQRKEEARKAYEEVDTLESLVQGMFVSYDELLDDLEKAANSVQRAVTRIRNTVKERKAEIDQILERDK